MTRLSLLLSALLALASAKAATDVPVTVAPGVSGAWLQPDAHWDGRTVLFFHGFADDMDGAGDLTKRCAHALADQGIASLRINFRGEGDRLRTDIESTHGTRIEDAEAGYAFVLARPGVAKAHVGAIGWSLGTATGIEVAAHHPGWISSLIVWSSLSGNVYDSLMTLQGAADAVATGTGIDVVPGWKTITTHRAFYVGYQGVDVLALLPKYTGAFLSIRGENDFLPKNDAALVAAAGGRRVEAVLIKGADHTFNVLTPDKTDSDRLVAVTAEWLASTL